MSKEYWMGEYIAERTVKSMKSRVEFAGEDLEAGVAVSMINDKLYKPKMINHLEFSGSSDIITTVKLDSTRIFVVHGKTARVLTVTDGVVTSAGNVSSAYTENSVNAAHAVLIDVDKVLLVYNTSAIIASINGSSISFGTPIIYETGAVSSGGIGLVKLATNKALLGWNDSTNDSVSAAILTVSGTTITLNTPLSLESSYDTNAMGIIALTETKALIVYKKGPTGNILATVLSISGNTITKGTPLDLSEKTYRTLCFLDTNKVLLILGTTVRLLTISGTTVTAEDTTGLTVNTDVRLVYISQNTFALISGRTIYIDTISGTDITPSYSYNYSPTSDVSQVDAFLFDTGRIFIITYNAGKYLARNLTFSGTTITGEWVTPIDGFTRTGTVIINGVRAVVYESLTLL